LCGAKIPDAGGAANHGRSRLSSRLNAARKGGGSPKGLTPQVGRKTVGAQHRFTNTDSLDIKFRTL